MVLLSNKICLIISENLSVNSLCTKESIFELYKVPVSLNSKNCANGESIMLYGSTIPVSSGISGICLFNKIQPSESEYGLDSELV